MSAEREQQQMDLLMRLAKELQLPGPNCRCVECGIDRTVKATAVAMLVGMLEGDLSRRGVPRDVAAGIVEQYRQRGLAIEAEVGLDDQGPRPDGPDGSSPDPETRH